MCKTAAFFTLVITILFLSFSTTYAKELTLFTHTIAPFCYKENGDITGFAVELVEKIATKLGHTVVFKMLPFNRGLRRTQTKHNTIFFIAARRKDREDTVKWVGPLISSSVYFFYHKDHPVSVKNTGDLRKLPVIGVGRGNADHVYLRKTGFTNLYPVNNHDQALTLLQRGKISVTPISELVMPQVARKAGLNPESIRRTPCKLYESDLYIIFSKDIPDSTIAKWQSTLKSIKQNGGYNWLIKKYHMPSSYLLPSPVTQ